MEKQIKDEDLDKTREQQVDLEKSQPSFIICICSAFDVVFVHVLNLNT